MITIILAAAIVLWPDTTVVLDDVTVTDTRQLDFQMHSSQSAVQVSRDYMQRNFGGSLMQTLQGIPGVKAMSIGSGQSKPMIRGFGFNRMTVSEDGIKHEGQQWGDDHGLEIDQFAVERAEIIKGPAALLYGSDAIGGVLSLYSRHIPEHGFEGSVQLVVRSVNDQTGISAGLRGRKGRFFYNMNITWLDYSDSKVPADSIQYYSYYIRLKDRRLRNTAGRERDGAVLLGYEGYRFHTDVRVSDSYSQSGFFANAHGLEVRLSDIDYDRSVRDIDLPSQWVNHLKVLSHTTWQADGFGIEAGLAYQNNLREELSEPVSHGYRDWFRTPDMQGDSVYMERSADSRRRFSSVTWSVGVNRRIGEWVFKANVGKSFRIPIPKELGTDGINYHIFRYERGNAALDPEESYQLDMGVTFESERLSIQADPFVNYFPNYIYLNPTSVYVEGLQLYHYTQARVFRWGFETQMTVRLLSHLETELSWEYLYARQLSGPKRGYTLPFSPPWAGRVELRYGIKGVYAGLNARFTGDRNEIVPPEKPTPGHWTLNLQAGGQFTAGKYKVRVLLHADNLLDMRYYDHTSYYRLIDVPEPGRNMSVMIALDF